MNILDRLDELERESGIHGAIAYQDLLHVHGRALIDVAREAHRACALVSEQAEDDGLWFFAESAAEGYLQQELRRLHAAVEAIPFAPLLAEDDGQTLSSGYAMDAQAREWARAAEDEA